jgi:uncharacterized protein (TIGR02145 family)
MKKNLTMLLLLAVSLFQTLSYAQAPNGINYQAVIRNSTGALSSNTPVAIRVNIRQTTTTGTIVYSERQNVTTDQFGLVNFVIGSGTLLTGNFANIPWANGPFFLDLGVAFSGLPAPIIYMPYGTQQMMSVPYALYAKNAGNQLNQWRYGNTVPATALGVLGDFYLNMTNGNVYYKSNATTWILTGNITGPTGATGATGLTGATGPAGSNGTNGTAVLNGNTNPGAGVGVNGDFYINTSTNELFGPKTNGIWPAGVSLVGPQGIQGIAGPQGLQGTTGATGLTGAAGPQGPIGLTGPQGATGPSGAAGTNGAQGIQGLPGVPGPTGATGLTGAAGAAGLTGPAGAQGIQGVAGPTGPAGAVGATGPAGAQGIQGLPGTNGAVGSTGPAGAQGIQGLPGTNGTNGAVGATGPAGAAGTNGINGTNGTAVLNGNTNPVAGTGVNGDFYINTATNTLFGPKANGTWQAGVSLVGPQGIQGVAGPTGLQGPVGLTGPAGVAGPAGAVGATGPAGAQGIQGLPGTNGAVGSTGPAGAQGIQGLPGTNGTNGAVGATGPAGAQGIQGATGLLTSGSAAGNTPYWNGSQWVVNGTNLFNNGSNLGVGTTSPHASAITDLTSTTQGFLPPRMTTTQRNAIASPAAGLTIYNTTVNCLQWWNGTIWYDGCGNNTPSAALTTINCGGASTTGTLTNGSTANGVSTAIPYTGGNAGTYSAQSVSSTGVVGLTATLAAGTLANGVGSLTYTITGTPTTSGTASFAITVGGQSCSFTVSVGAAQPQYPAGTVNCAGATTVIDVTNPTTGKTWMDRNLGATQVATSSTDAVSYGDLYQWGRRADGHQCRTSPTTATLSSIDQPAHGNFITINSGNYDWRSPQNVNLWQGVNGLNNPCPSGYRIPTETEMNAERLSWSQNNSAGAFASPLKWTLAGYRFYDNGSLLDVGSSGSYWSSTVSGTTSRRLYFYSSNANMNAFYRANGFTVRCLKD